MNIKEEKHFQVPDNLILGGLRSLVLGCRGEPGGGIINNTSRDHRKTWQSSLSLLRGWDVTSRDEAESRRQVVN